MQCEKPPSGCLKCHRKAHHKLVDKWFCDRHFCEIVEQSIRRNLRKYQLKRNTELCVNDKACEYMIKRMIKVPITIVTVKKKADFLVIPWTLDDENEGFLRSVIGQTTLGEDPKVIKLFYPVSKKDLRTYFTLKKVTYRPKKTRVDALMDSLEAKHPGTKRSLLKSKEKLRSVE